MVPKLREPRQLFGFCANEMGPQQLARWPAEIQVLNERVKHIRYIPNEREPLYKQTGKENNPMSRSSRFEGRPVYEYEPMVGGFFVRSRTGGCREGCREASVRLESDNDTTLIFESRFESGNLAKAVQISEFEYELWLRNDLYTNKHTQWYYFRVSNTRANKTYRFTIVNLMKPDSLYNNGMRPLMYSEKNANDIKIGWVRGGSNIKYYRNNIKYTVGKSDRWYYSLTWTCQFDHDRDTVYFAHCFPYTYSDLQDYLTDVSNDPVKSKICKQRVLCRTLAGNMVYVLTITSPVKSPDEAKDRKYVVITSRVHPGETNSSWMMKGFLDYLMGNSADAKLLRDTFIFKIVPMLNPDGVIVGNYRCSLAGRDLNRNYKTILKDSFPTIWHTRTMIKKLHTEREIVVYCDLHGHSRKQNVFIYGCENKGNPQRRLRERIFPFMLGMNSTDKFCYEGCKFKVQKSKEGTGRIVMWNLGIMNSYTMEATFAGSTLGKLKGYHFSVADFEAMGYQFCDTLLDYCDPDQSKSAKILVMLENRAKQEILLHLKQKEGLLGDKDIEDINLDEDYSSACESSDGGSDSSGSDGLPMHLQFMKERMGVKRRKKLKSKKERDKAKTQAAKEEKKNDKQSPPQSVPEKAKVTKVLAKSASGQRSKLDGRIGSGIPLFTAEREKERERDREKEREKELRERKSTGEAYLENMANVYTKSVPKEQKSKDELEDSRSVLKTAKKVKPSSAKSEKSAPPAAMERKSSNLHLVELANAQQKHQDLLQQAKVSPQNRETVYVEPYPKEKREEVENSIKQHPLPFDKGLEKEKTHDTVKRGTSASSQSQPGSAYGRYSATQRLDRRGSQESYSNQDDPNKRKQNPRRITNEVYSSKNTPAVDQTVVQEISWQGSKQTLQDVPLDKAKELYAMPSITQKSNSLYHNHHHNVPKSTSELYQMQGTKQTSNDHHVRHSKSISPITPPQNYHPQHSQRVVLVSTNSTMKKDKRHTQTDHRQIPADSELTDTINSINELRESLMSPATRKNLSPTTGEFIDHFVRKTDEEINAITADIKNGLQRDHSIQADQLRAVKSSTLSDKGVKSQMQTQYTRSAIELKNSNNGESTSNPHQYHSQQNGSELNVQTRETSVSGKAQYSQPSRHQSQEASKQHKNSDSTDILYKENMESNNKATTFQQNHNYSLLEKANRNPPGGGTHTYTSFVGNENGVIERLKNPDAEANEYTEKSRVENTWRPQQANITRLNSSENIKRIASTPTKISLMISRGHVPDATHSGLYPQPLPRGSRPPTLRNMPTKKR